MKDEPVHIHTSTRGSGRPSKGDARSDNIAPILRRAIARLFLIVSLRVHKPVRQYERAAADMPQRGTGNARSMNTSLQLERDRVAKSHSEQSSRVLGGKEREESSELSALLYV